MKYLIILCTAFLSTAKVSCQSAFAKKGVKTAADSIFFNAMIFTAAALFFSPGLASLTPMVIPYAALYAACTVAFQVTYTLALSNGNVSIAVMFANFGTLIPVLVSLTLGECPSAVRLIGISLTVCSLVIMAKPSRGGISKRALATSLAAMLLNGSGLTVQKLFARSGFTGGSYVFTAAAYSFAAVFCAVVYIVLTMAKKRRTFSLGVRPIVCAAAAGLSLGAFFTVHTYAAGIIDGSFLYPAHSGGAILLSTLAGILLFRDKLTRRQMISFMLGLVAIVLMNW